MSKKSIYLRTLAYVIIMCIAGIGMRFSLGNLHGPMMWMCNLICALLNMAGFLAFVIPMCEALLANMRNNAACNPAE